ncbi:hypothetical protein OAS21_00120 [Pelagibacteraceae bacterium]|nr:hypothetical protein [Pelagibacteraceae bacterium]
MKIIDCFMYFDEDMMLDVRLNILNKFVSNFVICEASYNHKGIKKELKFDINKFSKFKDKIIYLPLEKQPNNLREFKKDDTEHLRNSKTLDNSLIRENFQRNHLANGLDKFSDNDLIIINDLDEIPNLENFKYRKKITMFNQQMFYYKFNLIYPNFSWTGSKICKKKYLINPQWLRNVKAKNYSFWRFDTLFSKKKYRDIQFINNGGWHFTNLKSAEDIDHKMNNFLHHLEYEKSGLTVEDIKKNILEKKVIYDHFADKRTDKVKSTGRLEKININKLPEYISVNYNKFKDWID